VRLEISCSCVISPAVNPKDCGIFLLANDSINYQVRIFKPALLRLFTIPGRSWEEWGRVVLGGILSGILMEAGTLTESEARTIGQHGRSLRWLSCRNSPTGKG
jgi:hypothetical protein